MNTHPVTPGKLLNGPRGTRYKMKAYFLGILQVLLFLLAKKIVLFITDTRRFITIVASANDPARAQPMPNFANANLIEFSNMAQLKAYTMRLIQNGGLIVWPAISLHFISSLWPYKDPTFPKKHTRCQKQTSILGWRPWGNH